MICTALSQSVYAADTISFDDEDTNISESFEPTDDSMEFDDVQLISTQINNGVMRTSYSVNWTISANKYKQDTKALTLQNGDYIYFDLKISPKPTENINIGAVNKDTNIYRNTSTQDSECVHFLSIVADGEYYVRIKNNTSKNITVTGTYEVVNYVDSIILSVPLYQQKETKWCWAACIQMCAKYKGYTATQASIVKAAKDEEVNEGASRPKDYSKGMESATKKKYTATKSDGILTASEIKKILKSDLPLIISMSQYSNGVKTSSHANVVVAVDKDNNFIKVNDPNYYGASRKNFKYSVITSSDSDWRYSATVKIKKM